MCIVHVRCMLYVFSVLLYDFITHMQQVHDHESGVLHIEAQQARLRVLQSPY
jgi:hypothetical protein